MSMNMNKPAIKVSCLTKSFKIPIDKNPNIKNRILSGFKATKYRKFTPLKNVDFDVMPGDFFGIVGRNGSGKSTLLKSIAGIYNPDSGYVRVNGSLIPFIELGVGFNPELSGRENVYLSCALLGFSREEVDGMYNEIVDFAELHDFMEERLRNYSSGMQVRLAFSISIRAKGDILLLDEVLAVGDANFRKKCFDYFKKLKSENKTVILVSHDMDQVNKFCTKALLLDSGKIIAFGSPEEVTKAYVEANQRKLEQNKNHKGEAEVSKVSIDSVQVFNGVYDKSNKLNTGEDIIVTIDYSAHSSIDKFNIGIGVISDSYGYVFGYNTQMDGYVVKSDGKAIKIVLKKIPLLKGRYSINVVCFGDDESDPYDLKQHAASFTVHGENPINQYRGVVNIDHSWEIDK